MKILITLTSSPIINDLYIALNNIGEEFGIWNPNNSLYDILDREKVDLFFSESQYDHLYREAIEEFNIPSVIFGMNNPLKNQQLVCLLNNIPETILKNIPIPYYIIKPGANILQTLNIEPFDVLYICDQITEKGMSLIQYLNNNGVQLKIVGNARLPFVQYLGKVNTAERLILCKGAKIVLLDDITYSYDVGISRSLAIYIPNITKEFVLNRITHFEEDKEHKDNTINFNKKDAMVNTYYHRLVDIFRKIHQPLLANKCEQTLLKILE